MVRGYDRGRAASRSEHCENLQVHTPGNLLVSTASSMENLIYRLASRLRRRSYSANNSAESNETIAAFSPWRLAPGSTSRGAPRMRRFGYRRSIPNKSPAHPLTNSPAHLAHAARDALLLRARRHEPVLRPQRWRPRAFYRRHFLRARGGLRTHRDAAHCGVSRPPDNLPQSRLGRGHADGPIARQLRLEQAGGGMAQSSEGTGRAGEAGRGLSELWNDGLVRRRTRNFQVHG